MSGPNRPQLGWKVVDDEWAEFEEMVAEKYGTVTLYAGLELERAWSEFRDVHPIEERVNRLLDTAGLPRSGDEEKNPDSLDPINDLETSKTWVRVHADVKADMKQYAASEGTACHEVLRWVVNWYREGGRDARIGEKLDCVVPAVEAMAAHQDENSKLEDGLGAVERRARSVCRAVAADAGGSENLKEIPENRLRDIIRDTLGVTSKPTVDNYVGEVVDRFDLIRVETPKDYPDRLLTGWAYAEEHGVEHPEDTEREKAEAEADEALAALNTAEAVTDGGQPI